MAAFPTVRPAHAPTARRARGRPAPGPGSCPTSATPRRRTPWRACDGPASRRRWSGSTSSRGRRSPGRPAPPRQQRENRYVVEGLMRGLRDAGFSYGVYSYLSGWTAITGSWWLPGVPVWATAGRLDYPTEALDRCRSASFSGGRGAPVPVVRRHPRLRPHLRPVRLHGRCRAGLDAVRLDGRLQRRLEERRARPRDAPPPTCGCTPGRAAARSSRGVRIGTGWRGYRRPRDRRATSTATATSTSSPGSGPPATCGSTRATAAAAGSPASASAAAGTSSTPSSVPATSPATSAPTSWPGERATGYLWLYPGNGRGGWLPRVGVGTGWNIFSAIVGPGDLNGDGAADLLARQPSNGYLWLYPGNGRGGWLPRVRVGTGWNGMTAIDERRRPHRRPRPRRPGPRPVRQAVALPAQRRPARGCPACALGAGWNTVNALF